MNRVLLFHQCFQANLPEIKSILSQDCLSIAQPGITFASLQLMNWRNLLILHLPRNPALTLQ